MQRSLKSWARLFLAISIALTATGRSADLLTTAEHTFYQSDNTRVGIEVEFTGLEIEKVVRLVSRALNAPAKSRYIPMKTTLKGYDKDGTAIYNEELLQEYVLESEALGEVILKIDNNMVSDTGEIDPKAAVIELVTAPIREAQVGVLQEIMNRLRKAGALGTSKDRAVSIQTNVEIAEGKIDQVDWKQIVDTVRTYVKYEKQIDKNLQVPAIRRKYLKQFTPGFVAKVLDPSYRISARGLYDDLIYRQTLEYMGKPKAAWRLPIDEVRKRVLSAKNPIVPEVVKQNRLRLSSLLMKAFPNDPMSKLYDVSGWAKARPLIEFRERNNDFNVIAPFKQSVGLIQAAKQHGYYDLDKLIYSMSGVSEDTVKKLRRGGLASTLTGDTLIFRYFIGDPKEVNPADYREMKKAYADTVVGFLPLKEYGEKPLVVPGESVVFHRLPLHRNSIVGKYNPTLINTNLVQALENKYTEGRFWNEFSPGSMPETVLLEHLISSKDGGQLPVKAIAEKLSEKFPEGWVMKGVWDLGSEKQIVTDKTDLIGEVERYLKSDFNQYKARVEADFAAAGTAPEYLLNEIKKHPNYMGYKLYSMLSSPGLSIVQNRVDIDREFRVEVVAGKVLGRGSTFDRWWYTFKYGGKMNEYVPVPKKTIKAVEQFAQRAVNQLPKELRNMTFGMDIATLKNGGMIMIESNPGGNSNFLFEEEKISVRALRERLEEFPEEVRKGKVNLGLSPAKQMEFLRAKFADWKINIAKLYPGMDFKADRIVDAEFIQTRSNPKFYRAERSKGQAHLGVMACKDVFARIR